jgi:hypothetical protein
MLMKTKKKLWVIGLIGIGAIFMAFAIYRTIHKGQYWVLIIEIPFLLYFVTDTIVSIYNFFSNSEEQKKNWEAMGENIYDFYKMVEIDPDTVKIIRPQTLQNWFAWVAEHQTQTEVTNAFKEILNNVVNAAEDTNLPQSTREEAKVLLLKLTSLSKTEKG